MFGQQFDLGVAAQGGIFQLDLGAVQGAEVAAAGEKQAFALALPADFGQQRLLEQIQPLMLLG